MKITIYTFCYNEEIMLPFMIEWYRKRFPDCNIIVFDNESIDKTKEIALSNNCEVIPYLTNNQIQDRKLRDTKNHCWKNAETDWVLVCDCDELLDITHLELEEWHRKGATLVPGVGINMVNMADNFDLAAIKTGYRTIDYDKILLFNKSKISEMDYSPGAHACKPHGILKASVSYSLFHYRFINPDYMVSRYAEYKSRLSSENIEYSWGYQYQFTENQVRAQFDVARHRSYKVIHS